MTDPAARGPARVRVDRVVEFHPDGTVERTLALEEVLSLERLGYGSLGLVDGARDWSHANTAALSPSGDGLLLSARHQDAVFEVDRSTGALRWLLANPANWPPELEAKRLQPIGALSWPYHMHAPELEADGRLLLFDDGNFRASPWTGEPQLDAADTWSRVVEYQLDVEAGTVEQTWEFELPGARMYSGAEGDVDRMPLTGNVLSLWGFVSHVDGIALVDVGKGNRSVRLVEFEPATGEVVLHLEFSSDGALLPLGWDGYRAQRIPAL